MTYFKLGVVAMVSCLLVASLAAEDFQSEIFPDLGTAITESGLDTTQVIQFDPVDYRDGVATYRLNVHGEKKMVYALVAASINPMRPDPPPASDISEKPLQIDLKSSPEVDAAVVPDVVPEKITSHPLSGRCAIRGYQHQNFVNQMMYTNLDYNAYTTQTHGINWNDELSSLRVGCHAILIYPAANWGGGGLFFPAYAQIPNLDVYGGFNDKASSHFIYCY